jgi:hypothetical protein
MANQADYYIEKVRYNDGHSRIVQVSVRLDKGKTLSEGFDMARKKMIDLLHQGKRFMTIYRSPEGKFRRGKLVSLIQMNSFEFIQTDPSPEKGDRLGDLPEY